MTTRLSSQCCGCVRGAVGVVFQCNRGAMERRWRGGGGRKVEGGGGETWRG